MTVGIHTLTARDVMTRRADTILATQTIHNAIDTLVSLGLSALPVVNEKGECVGMLSKTDIVRLTGRKEREGMDEARSITAAAFFGVGIDEVTNEVVGEVMTKTALTVREEDSITTVADRMLVNEVHHVPVCDVQDHVVGVVSSMDLVKAIRDTKTT